MHFLMRWYWLYVDPIELVIKKTYLCVLIFEQDVIHCPPTKMAATGVHRLGSGTALSTRPVGPRVTTASCYPRVPRCGVEKTWCGMIQW